MFSVVSVYPRESPYNAAAWFLSAQGSSPPGQGPTLQFAVPCPLHSFKSPDLSPQTCSHLFTMKHRLSKSGRLAFNWNGFLVMLWFQTVILRSRANVLMYHSFELIKLSSCDKLKRKLMFNRQIFCAFRAYMYHPLVDLWCMLGSHPHPLWTEWLTGVKALPCPKLGLKVVTSPLPQPIPQPNPTPHPLPPLC